MPDNLAIIKKIGDEHQHISRHVKLVGDTVSDNEALSALEQVSADWIPGQLNIIVDKQNRLMQTISLLNEGLKNHFAFEEEYLPPLLGELFMQALLLDHQEIRKEIEEAKSLVAKNKIEELDREQLLARESDVQQAMNSLCHLIEEHANREAVILDMAQRALKVNKKK